MPDDPPVGGWSEEIGKVVKPTYTPPSASPDLAAASRANQKKPTGPPDANSTPQPKINQGEGLGAFGERLRKWREQQRLAAQRKALSGNTNP